MKGFSINSQIKLILSFKISQEPRRSGRTLVKRAPYQYPSQISKYTPKQGFRHRSSFRTKQQLRDEIIALKGQITDLEKQLKAAMKKQTAMKKKMDHEMDPKNRSKRKAEDLEVQQQKKLRFDLKNL